MKAKTLLKHLSYILRFVLWWPEKSWSVIRKVLSVFVQALQPLITRETQSKLWVVLVFEVGGLFQYMKSQRNFCSREQVLFDHQSSGKIYYMKTFCPLVQSYLVVEYPIRLNQRKRSLSETYTGNRLRSVGGLHYYETILQRHLSSIKSCLVYF